MDWRRFFKPKTPQTPAQTPQITSAIPMLDQVMSATKGATDAFSGVGNQVNTSFRKMGSSSIQGMVGYGIGFSHGFGLGRSSNQLQSRLAEPMTKMIGLIPGLPFGRAPFPAPASSKSAESKVPTDQVSAESVMQIATKSTDQVSQGNMMQLASKSANQISQGLVGYQPTKIDSDFDNKALERAVVDSASNSQTENVIRNFPQNLSLKGEGGGLHEAGGLMQPENKLLQTVIKQRQIIDELVEENEKLCQILQVKDLKIQSTKLQAGSSDSNIQTFPSTEIQDKITGGSRPTGDADGTLTTSKGENEGTLPISKGENDGTLPISKGVNNGTLPISSNGENDGKAK